MSDPYHQPRFTRFRTISGTTNLPGWAVVLAAIVAFGLGIGLFLLSAGILLIVAPLAIIGLLYARWRLRRALRRATKNSPIETEYYVIDTKKGP
jgi:uncharacterized protein (DUF2062 family)